MSSTAFAGAKSYQVTGPIVEVTDSMIVVTKGKERFEIDRDSNTKVTGDLKVGDKVTIMYTMTAKEVEVKADKSAKKDAKASTSPALRQRNSFAMRGGRRSGAPDPYLRRPPPRIPPSNPRMISRPIWVLADRTTLFTMLVARTVASAAARADLGCEDLSEKRRLLLRAWPAQPALRPRSRGCAVTFSVARRLQFFVGRFAIDRLLVMAGHDR